MAARVDSGRRPPARGVAVSLGPYAVLMLAMAVVWLRYDSLPAEIPLHYDVTGRPDRWVERSWVAAFFPLGVALFLCLALRGGAAATLRFSRPPRSHASLRQRRTTLDVLLGVEYAMSLIFTAVACFPLLPPALRSGAVIALVVGSGPAILILVAWLSGRSEAPPNAAATPSTAVPSSTAAPSSPAADQDAFVEHDPSEDDRHWRGGLIYHNPADPALLVPKRLGGGYTLNFGHPRAWWALVVVAAVPLTIVAMSWLVVR